MAPRVGNRLSMCACVCRDGLCREMQKHMLMKQSSLIFQIKSRKDHNPKIHPLTSLTAQTTHFCARLGSNSAVF